ncbi:hypothetical protein SAY87_026328 [Trapa incisa]|uniref:ZF-HD dimerization-type domain-containing protein n=1 Tax=Trapa incisa TaxID=236973 RepID=A0AAN7JCZ0_9MYRT|nr:hypothetical protein SAY87_026328 [Trapa incisa]
MRKRQVATATVRRSEGSPSSALRGAVHYGECRKNHAASLGGYATDGCREFMASGEEGTANALSCAACGCHRSFHRRQMDTAEVVCEYTPPSQSRGRYLIGIGIGNTVFWVFRRPQISFGKEIDSVCCSLWIGVLL